MQLWSQSNCVISTSLRGCRLLICVTQTVQTHPEEQQSEHPSAMEICSVFVKTVRGQGLLREFCLQNVIPPQLLEDGGYCEERQGRRLLRFIPQHHRKRT